MILPTVHLNGTSAEALLSQNIETRKALRRAIEALEGAAPNARDYYPQGPSAFTQASLEHAVRVQHLKTVMEEISEIIEHLDEVTTKRRHY